MSKMVSSSSATSAKGPQPVPFRIPQERGMAREVIEELRAERRYRDRLSIQVTARVRPCVGVAMKAAITPQCSRC